MKEKIAVILNTNQLGGAERSLIEQLSLIKNKKEFIFFIPNLKSPSKELIIEIEKRGPFQIRKYYYPDVVYKISRANFLKIFYLLFYLPLFVFSLFYWHKKFSMFKTFYVNGNKASFPILSWATFFRKKIKVYWHFRDFPEKRFFSIIAFCLKKASLINQGLELHLISNSNAVAYELKTFFPDQKIEVLYNFVGNLPQRNSRPIRCIGVVSMHAPWKGLHTVLLMAKLYEMELKELGIKKIVFFGGNIYQTRGRHCSYSNELRKLSKKLPSDLIEWVEGKKPENIYDSIDLLIHSSVAPEPFGRVIAEAFKSKIPVISTALGGSLELVGYDEFGVRYIVHDYNDMFLKIKHLLTNQNKTAQLVEKSYLKIQSMEAEITKTLNQLLT